MTHPRASLRRWLPWLALAVAFSVACGFLANWQLSRRAQVIAVIERIDSNFNSKPVQLHSLVPNVLASPLIHEYRPVRIKGKYLNKPFLVRNRPLNGQPGFEQLVPFQTIDGSVVMVDRGWLPTGNKQDYPDDVPMPSFAEQQVLGRIKLGEPDLNRQQPPRWQLASIDLADAKRQLGVRSEDFYSGVYLALDSEGIEQATMPTSLSKPQITEGNHLSYAFQWVIFAIMAFVALGWAIRQELEYRRAEQDPNYMKKKRKAFGDEDKEAEDSLL